MAVIVLFGGRSDERHVSVASARMASEMFAGQISRVPLPRYLPA